ncbi:hypothetical protein TELCIR_12800 [Teladorsagia circumcincta]|uniref:Uncharacterized protein n=1 Tax=Teladorsagia circumcincta TaxID=45464 RepID=A0A2G9U5M7_TELCI|nr:hypothetical protein TELCIR_12800 [Teladorsagia circumcincta]
MADNPSQANENAENPPKEKVEETASPDGKAGSARPYIEPFHRVLKEPITLAQLTEQLQRILSKLDMNVKEGDGLTVVGSAVGPLIASWRKRDAHSERYLRIGSLSQNLHCTKGILYLTMRQSRERKRSYTRQFPALGNLCWVSTPSSLERDSIIFRREFLVTRQWAAWKTLIRKRKTSKVEQGHHGHEMVLCIPKTKMMNHECLQEELPTHTSKSGGLVSCVDPVMTKDHENIWLANFGMNLKDKRKK